MDTTLLHVHGGMSVADVRHRPITPPEHYNNHGPSNLLLVPFAGFSPLQPPMNRRHTAMPLRSSPLAGPALSSEGDEVRNVVEIASTPELASLHPPLSLRSPSRSHSSLGLSFSPPPSPTSPAPPTRRRASFVNLSRKHRSSSKNEEPPSPSSPSSSSSHLLITPHKVQRKSHSDPSHDSVPPRPRSLSQNSPPLLTKPGTPSRTRSGDHNNSPAAGVENWLTTNTYETTPRFSRLGLAASSVVLPVSAREYKHKERRLSRTSSKTSLSSLDSLNTNMRPGSSSRAPSFIGTGIGSFLGSGDIASRGTSQSLPSLSLTRTTSGASGSGCSSRARSSMELRPPSPGMSGWPAPSLSDLCSLDEEDGDLGEFGLLPIPMMSQEKENINVKTPRVEKKRERQDSQPGNPGWRLRSISIKSLRSVKSTHKKNPTSEIRRPAGAEVTRLEVTLTRSHEPDDVHVKGVALDEKNLNQKQGNGLRKLWRTLTLSKGGRRRGTT